MMCCLLALVSFLIRSVGVVLGLIVFLVGAAYSLRMIYRIIFPKQERNSKGYEEQWFGREAGPPSGDDADQDLDTSVRPFKIDVSDEVLRDLKARLERTRFEEPVEDSKFLYGFNPNYLKKVVEYWRKEYDWRENEKMLNKFPHFKTRIEGIDIHFIHVKPNLPEDSKVRVIPLMVTHGWPGSIVEFYKIIPLLTTPRPDYNFVFEVVCPSIPGFGFSESPHQKGFTIRSAARIFVTLMERIGHRRFYVQGGDWGSAISVLMAKYYSPRVMGLHVNMFFTAMRPWEAVKFVAIALFPFLVTDAEYRTCFPIKRLLKLIYFEGGYFYIQSTKPDTLGCAMADSPAGMAAYLLEKFSSGFNIQNLKLEDGGLTKKFTMDELLTNVMMYWVNNNFTAAARLYKENLGILYTRRHGKVPVTVPTGIAVFPNEMLMFPKTCMSQQLQNIVSYNMMPRGGHFAAFEEPDLLADDVFQFVKLAEK